MKGLLICLVCLFLNKLFAQSFGNALPLVFLQNESYKSEPNSVLAITNNIASLARFKNNSIGLFIENRFSLKSLQNRGAIIILPTKEGNLGLMLQNAGFNNFSENFLQLNYARNLGSKVQLGIGFNYNSYKVPIYGNASAIGASVGIQFKVTNNFIAAFQAQNPMPIYLNKLANEKLISKYIFGGGYQASSELLIAFNIDHQQNVGTNINGSLTYQFSKQFFASLGYISFPGAYFGGLGYQKNNIKLDAGLQIHPSLGITPGISIQFDIAKKNEAK